VRVDLESTKHKPKVLKKRRKNTKNEGRKRQEKKTQTILKNQTN
jgi:hypothetical protein